MSLIPDSRHKSFITRCATTPCPWNKTECIVLAVMFHWLLNVLFWQTDLQIHQLYVVILERVWNIKSILLTLQIFNLGHNFTFICSFGKHLCTMNLWVWVVEHWRWKRNTNYYLYCFFRSVEWEWFLSILGSNVNTTVKLSGQGH